MDGAEFRASLAADKPPCPMRAELGALWWEARGDWKQAHALVASDNGGDAAWVHAYLHRREGDGPNALYWYRRAGRQAPRVSLDAERDAIVAALLAAADRAE